MAVLSKEDLLAADDVETRVVPVPEWGGDVIVKALTGKQRDEFESSMTRFVEGKPQPNTTNARAKLLVHALIGEDGKRLFDRSDINALGEKNALVLDRLYDIVAEMSGLQDKSEADAEGNSEAGQAGDSISDSPETSSTAP